MGRINGESIMVGSKTGGASIEDTVAKDSDAIVKVAVDIMDGISARQAMDIATKMEFEGPQVEASAKSIPSLHTVFIECECIVGFTVVAAARGPLVFSVETAARGRACGAKWHDVFLTVAAATRPKA